MVDQSQQNYSVTIYLVIVAQFSIEDLEFFCKDFNSSACQVLVVTPGKKLAVETKEINKRSIMVLCSAHPMVRWLEEKSEVMVLNKFASDIIQGNGNAMEQRHPFWEKNLTGDGEIIRDTVTEYFIFFFQISKSALIFSFPGISDTGVDTESCFFSDSRVRRQIRHSWLLTATYIGDVFAVAVVCAIRHNTESRALTLALPAKSFSEHLNAVCSQRNIRSDILSEEMGYTARFGDDCNGHGTSVAGSALGALSSRSSSFQGMAPGAKLAFDDLPTYNSVDGTLIFSTDDLNAQLPPHAYSVGARVSSMSWGHRLAYYDMSNMEVDTFLHDHPDHVVLAAAGNAEKSRK